MVGLPLVESATPSVAPACCKPEDDSAPQPAVEENQTQTEATPASSREPVPDSSLRIVLETDGPYMVPANLYESIPAIKGMYLPIPSLCELAILRCVVGKKLPLCHTAMIPWTSQFIANVAGEGWTWEHVDKDQSYSP
ncbi:hypothetical protein BKA70DRAFT_1528276 [Coprinopsis sp. MPI-PUGE-AT-0042]|nr:hypothetical protein BKA70DRAFT_1528276 [Coprinopsis sp. MPI-PUGE-AT-0042]